MYSGETSKRFFKHKRQLRDYIIQWSVNKCNLLINAEVNVLILHRINRTNDEFIQWEARRLLLLGLRSRDVSSRRDGSTIFLQIPYLNILRVSTLNTIIHVLRHIIGGVVEEALRKGEVGGGLNSELPHSCEFCRKLL